MSDIIYTHDYAPEFEMENWANNEMPALSAENLNKFKNGINESFDFTKALGLYVDKNIKYIQITTPGNMEKNTWVELGTVDSWDNSNANNYLGVLHTKYGSFDYGEASDVDFFKIDDYDCGVVYNSATSKTQIKISTNGAISAYITGDGIGRKVDVLLIPCNQQTI